MIYFVALVAGLAGILFGFDEGVIAGALSSLRAEFQITALEEGIMTAAVPFGALFGALLAGSLAERFGRRQTLLFASVLFVIGAFCAGLAPGAWVLTGCRLILGWRSASRRWWHLYIFLKVPPRGNAVCWFRCINLPLPSVFLLLTW